MQITHRWNATKVRKRDEVLVFYWGTIFDPGHYHTFRKVLGKAFLLPPTLTQSTAATSSIQVVATGFIRTTLELRRNKTA